MLEKALLVQRVTCTEVGSIASIRLRKSMMRVLGGLGDWQGVRSQGEIIQAALRDDTDRLADALENNPEWAMALVRTGEVAAGIQLLLEALAAIDEPEGIDHYAGAELRGLLAIAEMESGRTEQALATFRKALPTLLDADFGSAGRPGQAERTYRLQSILEAYLTLLASLRETPITQRAGIDPVTEMFETVAVMDGGRVRSALGASARRAAASDPRLADLVRREQDAEQEIDITLSAFLSLPNLDPRRNELKQRMAKLEAARTSINAEINASFPDFSSLTRSARPSITEVRARLKPGQALLTYHVTENQTYLWGLSVCPGS